MRVGCPHNLITTWCTYALDNIQVCIQRMNFYILDTFNIFLDILDLLP